MTMTTHPAISTIIPSRSVYRPK